LALLAAKRASKDPSNFDSAFVVAYKFEYNREMVNEIADAEEQIALWRLVSDNVWSAIHTQAEEQAKQRAAAEQQLKLKPKRKRKGSVAHTSPPPKSQAPIPPTADKQPSPTATANKPEQQNVIPRAYPATNTKQPITATAAPSATLANPTATVGNVDAHLRAPSAQHYAPYATTRTATTALSRRNTGDYTVRRV
jgi:hypothetical protein